MIKEHTIIKLMIALLIACALIGIGSANPYTIDGNSVYIDNEKAYISASPHTLTQSGYVYFDITSKVYTGNVDLALGFSSDKMKPTGAQYLNGNLNGNEEWVTINSLFNKETYNYDGLDTWYVAKNVPIIEDNDYKIRVWVDLLTWDIHNEKYGFAIKPSFQTLSQAISDGNLYYLDPWGNASSTPVILTPSNNQIYTTGNPIILDIQGTSGSWPNETITYYYYGDKVNGTTFIGSSSFNLSWYIYESGVYFWQVLAFNGTVYSDPSTLQTFTAVIPPVSRTNILSDGDYENWSSGLTSAPDGWSLSGGTIARSNVSYTGNHSASLTYSSGAEAYLQNTSASPGDYSYKTISYSAWLRSNIADRASLDIYDSQNGSGTYYNSRSLFHSGDSEWEKLTVTSKLHSNLDDILIRTTINSGAWENVVIDNAIVIEGIEAIELYPVNGSTISVSYPPLDDAVRLVWQSTGADQYRIVIATDVNFNLITVDTHTSNSYYSTNLQAGTFYWKVYAYDGTTYSDPSDTWTFTIESTADVTGPVVHGTVYSSDGYLSNSEVILSNSSDGIIGTQLTGSNGYYLFEGLNPGVIYSLTVNRDLYISATGNFNATTDPVVKDFYLLPDRTSEEWRHDVTFTVQSIWGTRYENVFVYAYLDTDVIPTFTGETGSDGSVTFYMNKNQQYSLNFIDSTQGISETRTLYPSDSKYYIIVSSTFGSWDTYDVPISEGINFTISNSIINSTAAYINFSYFDNLAETTALDVYLNQTNSSDYFNQTAIDSFSGAGNNTHSFIVTDYAGESYLIHLVAQHTTYGEIDSTYSISFSDDISTKFPGIPASVWLYGAIFMLLFVGGVWTASNVERGSLVTVVLFFVFYGLGCFATLPTATRTAMLAGGVLAFIIAVLMNLNKSNKDEGFQ